MYVCVCMCVRGHAAASMMCPSLSLLHSFSSAAAPSQTPFLLSRHRVFFFSLLTRRFIRQTFFITLFCCCCSVVVVVVFLFSFFTLFVCFAFFACACVLLCVLPPLTQSVFHIFSLSLSAFRFPFISLPSFLFYF